MLNENEVYETLFYIKTYDYEIIVSKTLNKDKFLIKEQNFQTGVKNVYRGEKMHILREDIINVNFNVEELSVLKREP